jgi:hypothetical protein
MAGLRELAVKIAAAASEQAAAASSVYQPNSVTVFLEQSPSVQASLSAD